MWGILSVVNEPKSQTIKKGIGVIPYKAKVSASTSQVDLCAVCLSAWPEPPPPHRGHSHPFWGLSGTGTGTAITQKHLDVPIIKQIDGGCAAAHYSGFELMKNLSGKPVIVTEWFSLQRSNKGDLWPVESIKW